MATVLVVDDTELGRGLMRQVLEGSALDVTVVEAKDGAEGLSMALRGDVDVVISDIVMPNLDGIAMLRALRKHKDQEMLPVVLVTSQTDFETRELSFEIGANDYLTRPFAPVELISRVQVQLRLQKLQQELRRTNETYKRLGSQDELTGLGNRRSWLDACHRELARSRRHSFALTVAVLDVDDFRAISAKEGHVVADALLAETAAILQQQLRGHDVLSRLNGERFALLLPQAEFAAGRQVCERVAVAMAAHAFPNHAVGEVTVSVGVSSYPDGNLESVDELTNAALASLDRARNAGGNRVEVWVAGKKSGI